MAQSGYSPLIESDTPSGAHLKYPKDVECIALKDCKKDVTSYLRFCKTFDAAINSELVSVSIFFKRCSLYMFIFKVKLNGN